MPTKHEFGLFTGERALFASSDLEIYDSIFADGESPLKESRNLYLRGCSFKWKYPLWYCKDVTVADSTLLETARSGIWYTENITMTSCLIEAPKTFRRSRGITLTDCTMPHALESLWGCEDVRLENLSVTGDYFGMNVKNLTADGLRISGNYAFDGREKLTSLTLDLKSNIKLRICYKVDADQSYGNYGMPPEEYLVRVYKGANILEGYAEKEFVTYETVQLDEDEFCVDIEIVAAKLSEDMVIVIDSPENGALGIAMQLSALYYAKAMSNSTEPGYANLMKAIKLYSDAANAYAASLAE